MRLILDCETYSPVDLTKAGVYAYAEHPDFQVLMLAYSVDGDEVRVAIGHEQIEAQVGHWLRDPEVVKVAHNSQFDRVALSAMLGMPVGQYLDPQQWDDSMVRAAQAGLPLKLEDLAKELKVTPKDTAGTRLINMFSKPNRKGERTLPAEKPAEWLDFIEYCAQDVSTLVEVLDQLPAWPTGTEWWNWVTDQRINDFGMQADLDLAAWAVEQDERNRKVASARLCELLEIHNAGSVPQLTAGLARVGLEVDNLRAGTIEELLARDDLSLVQREALELRQQTALVAARKYQAVLNSAGSDGRFRGGFRFYGAHTGRWSGRGVQLQNLPRAQVRWPQAVVLDSKLGYDADPQTLKGMVRAVFTGPFVVSDYSAIEARVLAWAAGEQWALDAFAARRDIYVETAQRMGGLTRQQGKVAVLALGYQGGPHSLRSMGAQGSDEELERMKGQWRAANRNIVRFWSDIEDAFYNGGRAGQVQVVVCGPDRKVYLPSGRFLVYRKVKRETWVVTDPETGEKVKKTGIRFTNSRGRADTYGGRLAENVVQAISRDLLADLLVRLDTLDFQVVGHVHDEVIVQDSGREGLLEEVVKLMSTGPDWAEGLPLNAEGFRCERYQKG